MVGMRPSTVRTPTPIHLWLQHGEHVRFCIGTRMWRFFWKFVWWTQKILGWLRKFWVHSENSGSAQKIPVRQNSSQKFLACGISRISPTVHWVFPKSEIFSDFAPRKFWALPENFGFNQKILAQSENSGCGMWNVIDHPQSVECWSNSRFCAGKCKSLFFHGMQNVIDQPQNVECWLNSCFCAGKCKSPFFHGMGNVIDQPQNTEFGSPWFLANTVAVRINCFLCSQLFVSITAIVFAAATAVHLIEEKGSLWSRRTLLACSLTAVPKLEQQLQSKLGPRFEAMAWQERMWGGQTCGVVAAWCFPKKVRDDDTKHGEEQQEAVWTKPDPQLCWHSVYWICVAS